MKHTGILPVLGIAIIALIAPAARADERDERRVAAARNAIKALKSEGAEKAVEILAGLDDPVQSLMGCSAVMRFLYWKEKNLPQTVALARAGIRFGLEKAAQVAKEDPEGAAEIKAHSKTLAYDLASFTWPGWEQEGIVIRDFDREAGLKAARLNLKLAKELEKPADKMSASYWMFGAQLLASGEHAAALAAFLRAKEFSLSAKEKLGAAMNDGYMGIVIHIRGEREDGMAALRKAIAELEAEGSEDAKFYAEQLRTAFRVFGGGGGALSREIECGPLVLHVHVSRTAQLFHIVDQLSAWSPECRTQYQTRFVLDKEDRTALELHAGNRRVKGWGGGLEQAFYTPKGLDEALFEAVRNGHLTNEEMLVHRSILTQLAGKVDPFINARLAMLTKFTESLDAERFTEAAKRLAGLCAVESMELPCFLIASEGHGFGGGFNGGRIALEVPPGGDAHTVLIHEIAHAFLLERREEIRQAAREAEELDSETLHEALAYAFAQGLHDRREGDPLAKRVAEHRERKQGLDDRESGARYRIFALALRPALRATLKDGEFAGLMKGAVEVWNRLREAEAGK